MKIILQVNNLYSLLSLNFSVLFLKRECDVINVLHFICDKKREIRENKILNWCIKFRNV